MTHPRRPAARRPGFTMVELLVVIALIATLAALSVGAVFRIRTAQQKSSTEATLQKLDTKLQQKLRAIQEQVRDPRRQQDAAYQTALNMANGSHDIAQAILMYAYTKQQLPMTFAEANPPLTPYAVDMTIGGYTLRLQKSPIFATLPAGTGGPEESAVCIHVALSTLGNEGLEQQIGDAPSLPGLKCYVDAYGQPIYFNRLAFGGDAGTELNGPPYVKAPVAVNTFDPFYPKQTNGAYRNLSVDYGVPNVALLWAATAPATLGNWSSTPAAYPGQVNHTAALISAGNDKDLLGLGLYSGDNIVSYRLRKEGQKGD